MDKSIPKPPFDPNDINIKKEMYQLVIDFLYSERMFSTAVVFQDECNMRSFEISTKRLPFS